MFFRPAGSRPNTRDALRRRARHRLGVYLAVSVGPAATSIDAVLAGPSRTLNSCFSQRNVIVGVGPPFTSADFGAGLYYLDAVESEPPPMARAAETRPEWELGKLWMRSELQQPVVRRNDCPCRAECGFAAMEPFLDLSSPDLRMRYWCSTYPLCRDRWT